MGSLVGVLGCRAAPSPEEPAATAAEPKLASTPAPPPVQTNAAATDLALDEAEAAAVTAACKELDNPVNCEASHRFDDFIVIRTFRQGGKGYRAAWYVLQRIEGKHRLLTSTETLRFGDENTEVDLLCWTYTAEARVSDGAGLLHAEVRDLDLDGRGDLLVECRKVSQVLRPEERQYMRYCLLDKQVCAPEILMRHVVRGEVVLDVGVEFVNGWFIRTPRKAPQDMDLENLKVTGKDIPDPHPG